MFLLRRLNGVCTQACTALTTTGDKYQTQNFIIPAPNRLNDLNKQYVIITFVASFIQTVTSPSNGKAFRSCCLALCKKSMSVRKQIHITQPGQGSCRVHTNKYAEFQVSPILNILGVLSYIKRLGNKKNYIKCYLLSILNNFCYGHPCDGIPDLKSLPSWFHYYITIHLRICLHGLDLLFQDHILRERSILSSN